MRVTTLASLTDLGSPVAAGEADAAARAVLENEVAELQQRKEELFRARRDRWEADIRRRFRILVAQTVRAECLLRLRHDGEAPDPRLVWMDLGQDQLSGWHNAELFREYLALDLTELLPSGPPGFDERPDRELARVRAQTGQALVDLIVEWRDTALVS